MMLKNSPPGVTTSLLMARPRLLMTSGAKITLKGLHDPLYLFAFQVGVFAHSSAQ